MRRTCYDLSPPCKQCERKCCRPGEYLSVMPADERTCKRKRRAPSSAPCDLAKASDGRTSESSKISEQQSTPHARACKCRKKNSCGPFSRKDGNKTCDATANAKTFCDHIAHQYFESDMEGRSRSEGAATSRQHNVIHRKTNEWQKLSKSPKRRKSQLDPLLIIEMN